MLVEQPLQREYEYVQQGSYLRHQQLFGVQSVVEKLKQLPKDNFQVYHGVSAEQHQVWQPAQGCSTHEAAISCEPISHNINSIFGGPVRKTFREFNSAVRRSFPKMKQEVSAFGPEHAEHARRFYQSTGTQPEFQQDLVPTFQPKYGCMQVSYIKQTQSNKGRGFLGESVFKRTINRTCTDSVSPQVPVHVSLKHEAVLKVAKISSRPNKKHPNDSKSFLGFSENLFKNKMNTGTLKNSIDSEDIQDDMDLSNAPVFQMLCEISKN